MQQLDNAVNYFNLHVYSKLETVNCCVAGGAVRDYFSIGYPTSDIDIFFPSETDYLVADTKFTAKNYPVLSDTDSAKMFKVDKQKIHLIKKHYYQTPEEIIADFDFTVCCAVVTREKVVHHESFFIDLARKHLQINNPKYPLNVLKRMQKFIQRGYWMCNGSMLILAKALATVNFDDKNENQLAFYSDGSPRFIKFD